MRKYILIIIGILVFCSLNFSAVAGREIKMDKQMQAAATEAIRIWGYNCPLAKMAFAQGADAYGDVVKVYCGPADRPGVYEKAVFRVTFTPDGKVTVTPWK